jgi:hypothetical protein
MGDPRPDESTLELALEVAEDVLTAPGLPMLGGATFRFAMSGATAVTLREPDRRALRDLMVPLRKFDLEHHDVALPRLYRVLERVGIRPEWRARFDAERDEMKAAREPSVYQVQEPGELAPDELEKLGRTPTWIRPHEAFRIWIYGEVIHDDYGKQRRWEEFEAFRQPIVRMMAHDYAIALIRHVDFLRAVICNGLEWTPPGAAARPAGRRRAPRATQREATAALRGRPGVSREGESPSAGESPEVAS